MGLTPTLVRSHLGVKEEPTREEHDKNQRKYSIINWLIKEVRIYEKKNIINIFLKLC